MKDPRASRPGELTDTIIECSDLRKSYLHGKRGVPILNGVNLKARAGSTTIIRGRSGAGKSTLLNLLGALDDPTSGSVRFCGIPYKGMTENDFELMRRGGIAHIHQNFNLIESWTAIENVIAALICQGIGRKECRGQAELSLARMGLSTKLGYLPAEMSMGEQQRVAVARALVHNPRLILADEPVGSVDPETGGLILTSLQELARSQGTALIIATHGNLPPDLGGSAFSLEGGVLTPQDQRILS